MDNLRLAIDVNRLIEAHLIACILLAHHHIVRQCRLGKIIAKANAALWMNAGSGLLFG